MLSKVRDGVHGFELGVHGSESTVCLVSIVRGA